MTAPRGLFVGLTTVDVVNRVARAPGPNEKVVATRADIAAGGPAAGAAVAFAGLGGDAVLLTAVGGGSLAALVRDDLERCRVRVEDAAPGCAGPSLSAVTVVDSTGDRSVVSRNAEDVDAPAPPHLDELVAQADVVLVDGHHPALALAASRAARDGGVPVVLDGGSWKPVLAELLPLTTMAVCSSAFRLPDGSAAGARLLDDGPSLVAVTSGPEPVRWWTRAASGATSVPASTARDTLGAGDVFHGAYAYAVAAGAAPVESLDLAAAVAALRVRHVGPRSWLDDPALADLTRAPLS